MKRAGKWLAAAAVLWSITASASDQPKNKSDSYTHDAPASAPGDSGGGNSNGDRKSVV